MANPISPEEQFYTPQEVADLFQVTGETIITWIKRGILDGVKVGGRYRISRAAVIKLGKSTYGS